MKKIGKMVLVVGVLLLVAGLTCTVFIESMAGPILLFASILTNSAAITMIRHRK